MSKSSVFGDKLETFLLHLSFDLEIEQKKQFLSHPANLSIDIKKLVNGWQNVDM